MKIIDDDESPLNGKIRPAKARGITAGVPSSHTLSVSFPMPSVN